jgi:CspA family cold shock protein
MSGERYFGTVLWFEPRRGFGFIKPDTMDKDLYVHHMQIQMDGYRKLEENQRVEFSIGSYNGKPQAEDVVPLTAEGSVSNGNQGNRVQA